MSGDSMLIPAIGISSSGLDAESRRMEVTANNLANAQTTKGVDGQVFRRKEVVFAARATETRMGREVPAGVEVRGVVDDMREPRRVYRPGHPDADPDGFVQMPDINPVEEMVNMMSATRAYEANLAVIKMAKTMATRALEIGK